MGLNLSPGEIAEFQKLDTGNQPDDGVQAVESLIRAQLLARYSSYSARGLDGIEPYARERNAIADPAAEIRSTLELAHPLKKLFPSYYRTWLDYPEDLPEEAEETYYWLRIDVENRPQLMLAHRVDAVFEGSEILGERYFYISHFANVGYTLVAVVSVEEGDLFFYVNRFWVDEWSGMPSLKHKLGQKMMGGEMRNRIERHEICR